MQPHRTTQFALRIAVSLLTCAPLVIAVPSRAQSSSDSAPAVSLPSSPVPSMPAPAPAAPSSPPVTTAPTAPLHNGKYLLAPGDVLRISVANYPAYNQESIQIPPDGVLALPNFNGIVRATGKTREAVQTALTRLLSQTMVNPRVIVTVIMARSAITGVVFVNGAVTRPGTMSIRDGYRLTELLSDFGGVAGRLDEVTATLSRHNGSVVKVDLYHAISYPNSPANVRLQPDDVLTVVPIIAGRVTVTGDVLRPGLYEMHRTPNPASGVNEIGMNARLSDILVAAGLPRAALDSGDVPQFSGTLLRQNTAKGRTTLVSMSLDLEAALAQRNTQANITLQPNDILDVEAKRPPRPIRFSIIGLVRSPGGYQMPDGVGVLEAVAQAGGLTQLPDQTVTTVVRAGQSIPIDLPKLLSSNDLKNNLPLQNGDVVRLASPDSIRVQVTGLIGIKSANALRLPLNATLQDALAAVGGITSPPQEVVVNVLRRNEAGTPQVLKVDPVALLSKGDLSQNVKLHDGDLISVADANRTRIVFVSGQIARPGQYVIKEGDDVVDLITQAGGPTPLAALTQVTLNRNGRTMAFDTYDAIKSGKQLQSPDAKLEQGDYVVIPQNTRGVYLIGAVPSQGIVPIPERETLTVLGALSRAGGLQASAKTEEVVLLRQGPNGTVVRDFLSLAGNAKTVAFNTPLQSGDVLYIPINRSSPDGLSIAQRTLGVLTTVLSVSRFY